MAKLELMSAAGVDQSAYGTFFRFSLKSIRWALFTDPQFAAHLNLKSPFPALCLARGRIASAKRDEVELPRRVAVYTVSTACDPWIATVCSC